MPMNIMTEEQVGALAGLMKDHRAGTAGVEELPHSMLSATLYGDQSTAPVWMGTISVAGHTREWATVLAC